MTSIGGLSSSSSATISGYGGLASGLDRDSLIEGMTIGTQTKIDNANRELQTLKWEQTAFQDMTKEIYEFTQKYTSYSSSSNLLLDSLYSMNQIEALGANSEFLSVSGSSTTTNPLKVLGVKNLAENAIATSTNRVTDGSISTGNISNSLSSSADVSSMIGQSITIKYGEDSYTIKIENTDNLPLSELDSPEEIATLINKAAEDVELKNGQTLADVVNFSASGGKFTITNTDPRGGEAWIERGTGDTLVKLGLLNEGETISDLGEDGNKITTSGLVMKNAADVVTEQSLADALSGSTIRFEYNGTVHEFDLKEFTNVETLSDLQTELQNKINTEIGKGRVQVDLTSTGAEGSLSFKTVLPSGAEDLNSSFSLVFADNNLLGENGFLKAEAGVSNRLNTSKSIAESGLLGASVDTSLPMTIQNADGTLIDLADYDLTWDSSVDQIINTINDIDELGIQIKYQSETDKFSITSTYDGAAGEINLSGSVSDALFGTSGLTVKDGVDAVVTVEYASGEIAEITRGSNTIKADGLEITVTGEFGYKEVVGADGSVTKELDETSQAVEFNVNIDTEATAEIVKSFIDDYNEILESVYTQVRERPDSDYYALTTAEKAEMSESEIELWEEEAKKGILYGDSTMNALADDMRFMIPATLRSEFEEMGITVSSNYADNGKLVFDQEKFEAALKEDPEAVKELLTGSEDSSSVGVNGLVTSVKDVMDKYASMTGSQKGLLVEKAGSEFAPTSVLQNSMLDEIESMEQEIEDLKELLQTETDRYTRQFTTLETLIAEMNSQSSYLSSLTF